MHDLEELRQFVVPWFRKEHWGTWCSIDRTLKGSFDSWRRASQEEVERHRELGYDVRAVEILPSEFLDWRCLRGQQFDEATARAVFAFWKLKRAEADGRVVFDKASQ